MAETSEQMPSKRRTLVVDDEELIANTLARWVEDAEVPLRYDLDDLSSQSYSGQRAVAMPVHLLYRYMQTRFKNPFHFPVDRP
jgi:hypothetical protein